MMNHPPLNPLPSREGNLGMTDRTLAKLSVSLREPEFFATQKPAIK
jgi:hypothetical protein